MPAEAYWKNRSKLLQMVQLLHSYGYRELHIIPILVQPKMHWHCYLTNQSGQVKLLASKWIESLERNEQGEMIEMSYTPKELAGLLVNGGEDFLRHCMGSDSSYAHWYNSLIDFLQEGELPYAVVERDSSLVYWKTSQDREIEVPESEKRFFLN